MTFYMFIILLPQKIILTNSRTYKITAQGYILIDINEIPSVKSFLIIKKIYFINN